MKLDFKSLAFGYSLEKGTSTPAWETSLGQGKDYKIKENKTIDELVKGMIYKAVSPKCISFKKGKGGAVVRGDEDNSALVIAAVFDKVFINDQRILGGKFILLIIKDDSESHRGRLKLKYGKDNAYKNESGDILKNEDFIELAKEQLGLASDACWFVTDISVKEQDELILTTTIINSEGSETYEDKNAHHAAWDPYYEEITETDLPVASICTGENVILYGVPGCGKSHFIEHDILGKNKDTKQYEGDFSEDNIIRTTFYMDYSNTDFVGQVLPKIVKGKNGEKDIVEYIFNPGPFTLALIQAIKNPSQKVALVVEEINRGNAPAIFGDIFQLLDRDENGVSEYGIVNVSVIDYLNTVNFGTESEPLYYTFKDIKIPGNMYIYATMNTSDQNVYTLDTAFTRRWSKERIPNGFKGNEIATMLVPGMKACTWANFVERINRRIKDRLDDLQVNEDKQIGCFFVKKMDLLAEGELDEGNKKAQAFAYKVLEYLWDDVSKLDHSIIFDTNLKTFEDLVKKYVSSGEKVFASNIFAINQEEILESND